MLGYEVLPGDLYFRNKIGTSYSRWLSFLKLKNGNFLYTSNDGRIVIWVPAISSNIDENFWVKVNT